MRAMTTVLRNPAAAPAAPGIDTVAVALGGFLCPVLPPVLVPSLDGLEKRPAPVERTANRQTAAHELREAEQHGAERRRVAADALAAAEDELSKAIALARFGDGDAAAVEAARDRLAV